ncbi:hypothetical protein GCM10011583_70390 [Streptomyces camponoticapitis]|uniref:Transposase DDE domain-containing protein n=1 Tax=Streptomyces camponoticapitis TaxID=1616125 RepID=A0ABQ2EVW1_9ACTN|nr:hypothetical protein GCM10011583_70390 [Streptomyces camponoticapitis]
MTVDLDGVLVIAQSDKEDAAPTWKKTYGHHPLMGFVDHGLGGTGEPVAALLRPGNAGSNTATDHITAAQLALAQLPKKYRRGRRTLIRTDSAGGTHDFVAWRARRGRWLSYSVGMMITAAIHSRVLRVPASAWTPAVEADGEIRDGAWVAELTGDILTGWPKGMRLIVRKERPHPGAQLRLTDADGMRLTCFATNTSGRPIAELRHRLRARISGFRALDSIEPRSMALRPLGGAHRLSAYIHDGPRTACICGAAITVTYAESHCCRCAAYPFGPEVDGDFSIADQREVEHDGDCLHDVMGRHGFFGSAEPQTKRVRVESTFSHHSVTAVMQHPVRVKVVEVNIQRDQDSVVDGIEYGR